MPITPSFNVTEELINLQVMACLNRKYLEGVKKTYFEDLSETNIKLVVCLCFFLLSLPTKRHKRDVTMRAVAFQGQESSSI